MAVRRCTPQCIIEKERAIVKLRQAERRLRRITEILTIRVLSEQDKLMYIGIALQDWI